jgi:hypothetical protein
MAIRHIRAQINSLRTNGKIEPFWKLLQAGGLRPRSLALAEEAEVVLNPFAAYYKYHRISGAIGWLIPFYWPQPLKARSALFITCTELSLRFKSCVQGGQGMQLVQIGLRTIAIYQVENDLIGSTSEQATDTVANGAEIAPRHDRVEELI